LDAAFFQLCLEHYIDPEKDLTDHFETALRSIKADKTDLWIFYLHCVSENPKTETALFHLLQRFIALNPNAKQTAKLLEIYLPMLKPEQSRELLHDLAANATRDIAIFCAKIFWQNAQYLKCSECLKNVIDANQANELVCKFFIAGKTF